MPAVTMKWGYGALWAGGSETAVSEGASEAARAFEGPSSAREHGFVYLVLRALPQALVPALCSDRDRFARPARAPAPRCRRATTRAHAWCDGRRRDRCDHACGARTWPPR